MDEILSSLKANHPVVVGLGSRGDLSHVFLVIEGHAVPVTKGIVAAVDRQLKLFFCDAVQISGWVQPYFSVFAACLCHCGRYSIASWRDWLTNAYSFKSWQWNFLIFFLVLKSFDNVLLHNFFVFLRLELLVPRFRYGNFD